MNFLGDITPMRRNPKKNGCMGPYAGVDYNLTLCRLQSRLQHIYHGQPMPELTLTLCQSRLYPQSGRIWPLIRNPKNPKPPLSTISLKKNEKDENRINSEQTVKVLSQKSCDTVSFVLTWHLFRISRLRDQPTSLWSPCMLSWLLVQRWNLWVS
jgi:hypothetical protein